MKKGSSMARRVPLLVLVAVSLLLGPLALVASTSEARAQAPDPVVAAAQADLGARLGADPAGLELLRVEAVVWNNGCIGAAEPDEGCTEALVDGFSLWLSDGDVAYRYHSDSTGTALRLAESMIPLSQVPVAPLPEGAVSASALERFLDLIASAGFDEIFVQELAALRDWIHGAFSPHYIVGGATLQLFEVASLGEVDAAINRLSQFGGDADLGSDQTLWRFDALIVILLGASERAEIEQLITDLIGSPAVSTVLSDPTPRPGSAALDTTVTAILDALKRAGIEGSLSDGAVHRPFLPSHTLSAVLTAGDASIEVFALLDPAAVDLALQKARELGLDGFAVWTRGSTIALIEGALEGDERSLIDAISAVLGSQRLAGDSLAPSGEVTPLGGGEPGALPATSNGGVAESDGGTPAWVWGVIAAVAVSAIAAGGAYRLWLRSRLA